MPAGGEAIEVRDRVDVVDAIAGLLVKMFQLFRRFIAQEAWRLRWSEGDRHDDGGPCGTGAIPSSEGGDRQARRFTK